MANIIVDAVNGNDTTGDGSLGNPYATIAKALTVLVAGDKIYTKNNAVHNIGATTLTLFGSSGGTALAPSCIEGFSTTLGDNGVAEIECTNNGTSIITFSSPATTSAFWALKNLRIIHRATTTKGNGITAVTGAGNFIVPFYAENLEIVSCAVGISFGSRGAFTGVVKRLTVRDCTGIGINLAAVNAGVLTLEECKIDNNIGGGIVVPANANTPLTLINTSVTRNGSSGIRYDISGRLNVPIRIKNCTIANNATDGIDISTGGVGTVTMSLESNVFYGNGRYGLNPCALSTIAQITRNAWGNNTSGNVNGSIITTGEYAIALSGFPFVSSTDFTPLRGNAEGNKLIGVGYNQGNIGAFDTNNVTSSRPSSRSFIV